jgi:hypothetical protein
MSEIRPENEPGIELETQFDPQLSGVIGKVADQERQIAPPAYLRQRVMDEFARHHNATSSRNVKPDRKSSWRWLSPWSWLNPSPVLLATSVCLILTGVAMNALRGRTDWLELRDGLQHSNAEQVVAGSGPAREVPPASGSQSDVLALADGVRLSLDQSSAIEEAAEIYTVYDDLLDATDFEYLIFINVPADQLSLEETFESVDIAGTEEVGVAIGDDGMVRAIQLPSRLMPY